MQGLDEVRVAPFLPCSCGVAGLLAAGRADEAARHRGSVGAAGALRPPPRLRLQREDLQGEAATPLPLLRRRRRRPRGTCTAGPQQMNTYDTFQKITYDTFLRS